MSVALYAGSFDPITYGHLAVLKAGLRLADKIIVAIGAHDSKKPLFSVKERKRLIEEAAAAYLGGDAKRVEAIAFAGLAVNEARKRGAVFLIRGLRGGADFDYEMQMANVNKMLAPDLQTVFLPAGSEHRSVSSSLTRQVASMGGDVSCFVPLNVAQALADKFAAGAGK